MKLIVLDPVCLRLQEGYEVFWANHWFVHLRALITPIHSIKQLYKGNALVLSNKVDSRQLMNWELNGTV